MATKKQYVEAYNANSNATLYIIAFISETAVYTVETKHLKNSWITWARTPSGKKKLRLHMTDTIRKQLRRMETCTYIGEASEIYAECNKYLNRGWVTEQMICKMLGIPWVHRKDEGAWYEDSDIIIGNVRIQVKFENGSIASAKSIESYL